MPALAWWMIGIVCVIVIMCWSRSTRLVLGAILLLVSAVGMVSEVLYERPLSAVLVGLPMIGFHVWGEWLQPKLKGWVSRRRAAGQSLTVRMQRHLAETDVLTDPNEVIARRTSFAKEIGLPETLFGLVRELECVAAERRRGNLDPEDSPWTFHLLPPARLSLLRLPALNKIGLHDFPRREQGEPATADRESSDDAEGVTRRFPPESEPLATVFEFIVGGQSYSLCVHDALGFGSHAVDYSMGRVASRRVRVVEQPERVVLDIVLAHKCYAYGDEALHSHHLEGFRPGLWTVELCALRDRLMMKGDRRMLVSQDLERMARESRFS